MKADTKSTLIDFFRAFQSTAEKNGFATSARVTYYSILHAWNEERRPDCLRIRRSTLQNLTGISESSVRNAIQILASTGWIKLNRTHGKNAPLAITLRNPCADGITIPKTNTNSAEPERVRTKAEPVPITAEPPPTKPISSDVAANAKLLLKKLKSIKMDFSSNEDY